MRLITRVIPGVFVLALTVCFVGGADAVHTANNVPAAVQCPASPHCWAGTVTISQVIDTNVDGSTSKENDVTTVTVDGAGTIVEHESPTGATVFGGELGKGTASLDSESRALNAHCAPDGAEGTYVSTLVGRVDGDGRVLVLPNDDERPTSLTIAATVDTNIPTTSTDNCNSFSRSTVGPGGGFSWQAVINVPAGWDGLHLHDTYSEPIPGYAAATTTTAKWTITWDLSRKARPGCPATSFSITCATDESKDTSPVPAERPKVDYSLAGVCGRIKSGNNGERCYVMLGAATIRAIKNHEKQFAGVIALTSSKAIDRAASAAFLNFKLRKLQSQAITYTVKALAGATAASVYSGISYTQLFGKILNVAIIAQRWGDLETAGYPHKCFLFQASYESKKPKIAFDAILSFVRSWDSANPPTYRPLFTSLGRWVAPGVGTGATLPLFCKGAQAEAVTVGSSSGVSDLLAPPFVRFSVNFNH